MSAGLASLSDDALLAQLRSSGFGGSGPAGAVPGAAPAVALPAVSALSDDDLMRHLAGARAPASQGRAPSTFDDRFNAGPMASATDASTPLGAGLRSKADEMLVGKPDGVNQAAAGVINAANAVGLNLPKAGGALAATALGKVGLGPDRTYAENYALAGDQADALSRQFPKTGLAGTVAGIGAGAVTLPGFQAAKGAGLAGQAVAAAGTGAAYGAAGSLFDAKDAGEVGKAALVGGTIGAVAAPVVTYVGKAVQALAPWVQKGVSFTNARGEYTPEAKAALGRAGVHPDLVPRRQLDDAIATTFTDKGVSEAAAREAAAAEFAIPLSRGQATGDQAAQQFEAAAAAGSRGTKAETVAKEFEARQQAAIDAARQRIDATAGRGVTLDNPTEAAEVIADQARSRLTRSTLDADTAQQAADAELARLRGSGAPDALDAGAAVGQGLRGAADRSRGAYREAYGEVGQIPGTFAPGALDRVGARVRDRLGPEVPIDDVLTPASSRALRDLDDLPGLFNLQPGEGPNLQQVEQLRKRLVSYYGGTAQNPADRRALGRVMDGLDQHIEDAMSVGLFGPQGAARAADDFPGSAAIRALDTPADAITMPAGPAGSSETFGRWLARNGGLEMTGDARAMDLHRAYYPGAGTLARRNGTPLDQIRVKATEAGFLPPGADGETAQEASGRIMDMLRAERIGQPRFRIEDEARIGGSRATDRIAEDNAAHTDAVSDQARRMAVEFDGMGLRPRDLDGGALHEAAERMVLGHADDAATAYEQAVARRGEAAQPERVPSRVADDVPFPAPGEGTTVATSDALPVGDLAPAEAMKNARSLFRAYKVDFAPQGAGDDVGLAMRKIVDRSAEPIEVSRMLYGGSPGLNIRIADRVKRIVGEDSDTWAAHQQGYLSSILNGRDMTPQAVSARIEDALSGQRRGLTARVLTDDQVSGLRRFQGATAQARLSREGVPDWVASLGRTDFDPNAIMGNLFGAGVPGARPGSTAYASALKRFVGEDSAEWSGLRQAAWRRLSGSDDGKSAIKPEALADRVLKFTKGPGSGLAKQMFTPAELGEMERFATALRFTFKPDGTLRGGDGGAGAKIASHDINAIAVSLGFKLAGPAGAGAAAGLRVGQRFVEGGLAGRKAVQSFNGGAPRLPPPGLISDFGPVGVGSGLLTDQTP